MQPWLVFCSHCPQVSMCMLLLQLPHVICKITLHVSYVCYGLWPKTMQLWQDMYTRKMYESNARWTQPREGSSVTAGSKKQFPTSSGRPISFKFPVFSSQHATKTVSAKLFLLVWGGGLWGDRLRRLCSGLTPDSTGVTPGSAQAVHMRCQGWTPISSRKVTTLPVGLSTPTFSFFFINKVLSCKLKKKKK